MDYVKLFHIVISYHDKNQFLFIIKNINKLAVLRINSIARKARQGRACYLVREEFPPTQSGWRWEAVMLGERST